MSAHGPILGDALAQPARAPRRTAGPGRAKSAETISTLAEAEQQLVSAARDLAWLAGELGRVTAESERRGAALLGARDECGRLSRQLVALEQLAGTVVSQVTTERAGADGRVREAREQAAAAIRMAESRASAGLRVAHEAVCEAAAAHAEAVARAAAVEPEAAAARAAAAAAEQRIAAANEAAAEREAVAAHALQAERGAAAREAEAVAESRAAEREPRDTARERRLGAELEHLRRERSEHEERLRAELDQARTEKLELRTRLSMCEHTLAERDRELARERKLADEAMRWASSVERELVLPPPAPAQAPAAAGDCAVKPPADPPLALRRRGSRVRLRPAG